LFHTFAVAAVKRPEPNAAAALDERLRQGEKASAAVDRALACLAGRAEQDGPP
jgi:hypothetical protein